ncbi:hypothetical protein BD414DRAFT_232805 [Trametes punicea]|nr:hypothetical protein BD414DRAFT_232805 [Trametes punicea]
MATCTDPLLTPTAGETTPKPPSAICCRDLSAGHVCLWISPKKCTVSWGPTPVHANRRHGHERYGGGFGQSLLPSEHGKH